MTKVLKIAGLVVLISWMIYTSWRLEQIQKTADIACTIAYNNAHREYVNCPRIYGTIYFPPEAPAEK